VTCPKSAPPRTLPPAVGAQKQGGALAPTMFLEQPDPSADSRGPENKEGLPDYVFRAAEAASPAQQHAPWRVLRGGGTWVGLRSRAEGVPTAGGRVCCISRLFIGRELPFTPTITPRKTLQGESRGDCRAREHH
jgi:hypothetical protein